MSEGTIVTFYSYKGGVGRTFALANVASLLSLWGFKTLCIDWDLEAPGLHYFFKPWLKKENRPGLTEMIQAYADGTKPNWRDFVTEVAIPGAPEPLLFIHAGTQDQFYVQRMQALDWNTLYESRKLGNFIEELREDWKESLDFVLIDSRTGITDIGSICTVQLPDILMLVLTANDQSLKGSLDILRSIRISRASFPLDRAKLLVVPVVSRFERRLEYNYADRWLARFAEEFPPMYSDWAHKDVSAKDLLNFIRIPYIPRWSFGEEIPAVLRGTKDADDVGFSLETLAALIAQKLAATDILVQSRDKYVTTARNTVSQQTTQAQQLKSGIRIFISYARSDKRFVEQLETHLKPLQRQGIVDEWYDYAIEPGQSWEEEINLRLEEANIILLLISPDYLASDYLYEKEMRQALERHELGQAVVIPILLRATVWSESPIAALQVLPTSAVPISKWRDRDDAWADVTRGILQRIDMLRSRTIM